MYKITGIYHNGRKDFRWNPVTEDKYKDLVGCKIKWDANSVKQFEPTNFDITDHSFYSWWNTSPVLQLSKGNGKYILETVNTIYVLEDLSDVNRERESN